MGHEPDLKASLEQSLSEYKVDVQIVDILRDKSELQLKREAEAEVMQPMVTDVPDKKEFVAGIYDIPEDAGTIKVKITDLLSESLEVEV